MIDKPLRINGSLRRRQPLMVMSPFMKLDLSQRSFPQVQGVDCDETFSTIAMLKSVKIMLAVVAFSFTKSGRWMSKQSFLDGFHEERLYVIQPEGLSILRMLNGMQTPAILLRTGESISELEHTL